MSESFQLALNQADEAIVALERQRTFLDLGLMPVLYRIRRLAREELKANYDTEGRRFGKKWPQLKPGTQKRREQLAAKFGLPITGPAPMLVNFGNLRRSVVDKSGPGHEERVDQHTIQIATTYRSAGSSMKETLAAVHDKGLGRVPARRLAHPDGVGYKARQKIFKWLREHQRKVARMGGFEGG